MAYSGGPRHEAAPSKQMKKRLQMIEVLGLRCLKSSRDQCQSHSLPCRYPTTGAPARLWLAHAPAARAQGKTPAFRPGDNQLWRTA